MAIADTTSTYPQARNRPGFCSQKQINFICDLMAAKDLFAMPQFFDAVNAMDAGEYERYLAAIRASLPDRSVRAASEMIGTLKALPEEKKSIREQGQETLARLDAGVAPTTTTSAQWEPRATQMPGYEDENFLVMSKGSRIVPRGSYGLETPGSQFTNDITFFSVWINDDGSRWTVRMYVSDERVKLARTTQYAVLDAIAENPEEAAACYGHNIGKCGLCGRKLTNDESRARGIGPICATKAGW